MNLLDFLRGIVRPAVTWVVVLAQIGFVAVGAYTGRFEAAELMMPVTMLVVGFWFVDRATRRRDQGAP